MLGRFEFEPIGYIQTPFKQRFGIPHQPGISDTAQGIVVLNSNPDFVTAVKRLEEFSHLWLVFVFHSHGGHKWKPSIRPPRLGGSEKVGLFASRSPHRPNPIGISAVKLDKIEFVKNNQVYIYVSGVDLLDGTPILDIKPYIPLADRIEEANQGWADIPVQKWQVKISESAEEKFKLLDHDGQLNLRNFSVQLIELDPRPAYQKRQIPVEEKNKGLKFGLTVKGFDVKYEILENGFVITDVLSLSE